MPDTESDDVSGRSGMCDLGERLVSKSLEGTSNGRLIEHIENCPRCAEETS